MRAQKAPVRATHLDRPVLLHVCKDGTVSYRTRAEPVFNGKALPVFSVNSVDEAQAIQVRFCRRGYGPHPQMPGRVWYKLSRLGDGTDPAMRQGGVLELDDLEGITAMFSAFYADLLARNQRTRP